MRFCNHHDQRYHPHPPKPGTDRRGHCPRDSPSVSGYRKGSRRHRALAALKDSCEFQIYTASNPIYKTRYAEVVPAEQFPVVLFQDATGGHIHAAGRSMIPSLPEELYSDLKHGFTLDKQAKQAQKTGAVKTKGYAWDNAITPTLYLSAEDCPDGYCPTPPSEDRRPLDRVRDLFDNATDRRLLCFP